MNERTRWNGYVITVIMVINQNERSRHTDNAPSLYPCPPHPWLGFVDSVNVVERVEVMRAEGGGGVVLKGGFHLRMQCQSKMICSLHLSTDIFLSLFFFVRALIMMIFSFLLDSSISNQFDLVWNTYIYMFFLPMIVSYEYFLWIPPPSWTTDYINPKISWDE